MMKPSLGLLFSIFIIFFILCSTALAQDNPPALNEFQQFFGTITGLPSGTFTLSAAIGGDEFTTPITSSGNYGIIQVFRVFSSTPGTITFSVFNGSADVTLGTALYAIGGRTRLDLAYPSAPPENGSAQPQEEDESDEEEEDDDDDAGSAQRGAQPDDGTQEEAPGTCRQSWNCGEWSSCFNALQTRSCFRVDNCDRLLLQGDVREVIESPKPGEQRTCQAAAQPGSAPNRICQPAQKRCLGAELQQCSFDGLQWQPQRQCEQGCDAATASCTEAVPSAGVSSSVYFIAGSIVLVAVILLLLFSFHKRSQLAPAKDYIKRSRERGLTNQEIRIKLVNQGWDPDKVDSLLK